jgi:uncharacterized protein
VRRTFLLVVAIALASTSGLGSALAQPEAEPLDVLVYTRTGDFRHLSIPAGIAAIEELGDEYGFGVEATEDPAAFTDENLARFGAVVFLNTTGNVVEDDGKVAFERYVRSGGAWVGVHSAADTEYDWPFYGELLGGAYFHSHPVQQPGVLEIEDHDHPSTAHLPERWLLPFEEFYSFVANPRGRVRVLMTIDESTYLQDPNTSHIPRGPELPEGESGVMGDDHPMSWCHDVDDGRAWYTALGHEPYLYSVPEYREHLAKGILSAARRIEADCTVPASEAVADDEPAEGETVADDPDDVGAEAPADAGTDDAASAAEGVGADDRGLLPVTGPAASTTPALLLLAFGAALARRRIRRDRTS